MTMAMDPKIACTGAGYWGKNLVRNFHALGRLSCVCEARPERRAELAAAYSDAQLTDSFEEVLADPQVTSVAIATPAETHGELLRRALLAGKDVFVEKPLCLSIAEGQGAPPGWAACSWWGTSCGITRPSSGLRRARTPFEEGLRRTIAWYRSTLNVGGANVHR